MFLKLSLVEESVEPQLHIFFTNYLKMKNKKLKLICLNMRFLVVGYRSRRSESRNMKPVDRSFIHAINIWWIFVIDLVLPFNAFTVFNLLILGLKKRVEHSETMGIFNGNEFAFQGSSLDLITFGKLLWTYGYDVIRISRFVGKLIEDFSR